VTPLLHCAFSATQVHGSRIFFSMWKKQKKLLAEANRGQIEGEEKKEGDEMMTSGTEVSEAGKSEVLSVKEVQAGGVV